MRDRTGMDLRERGDGEGLRGVNGGIADKIYHKENKIYFQLKEKFQTMLFYND